MKCIYRTSLAFILLGTLVPGLLMPFTSSVSATSSVKLRGHEGSIFTEANGWSNPVGLNTAQTINVDLVKSASTSSNDYEVGLTTRPMPTAQGGTDDEQVTVSPWPMFRHDPQRTGKSPYVGLQQVNAFKSIFEFGKVWEPYWPVGIPSVGTNGTIYLSNVALGLDGNLLWTTQVTTLSGAAISSDSITYAGYANGRLSALNPDGSVKWTFDPQTGLGAGDNYPALGPDGTIYAIFLYLRDDVPSYSKLFALNPDGVVKWEHQIDDWPYLSPAVGLDGTIYISAGHGLYAVKADGTRKWSKNLPVGYSIPVVSFDDNIYVVGYDRLYLFNPEGQLLWQTERLVVDPPMVLPMVALGNNQIAYLTALTENRLYAIGQNGSVLWSFNLDGSANDLVTDANGDIYLTTRNSVYAIESTGNLKWNYSTANTLFGSLNIAGNGVLYVTGRIGEIGHLFALGFDTTSPSSITDLAVTQLSSNSITLTWTAPGDDEDVGTASEYDVRYSTTEPPLEDESSWWSSAVQASSEPTAHSVGSVENFTITGLAQNTIYYFALKTADEVPNWSGLSNIVSGTTKEAEVISPGIYVLTELSGPTALAIDISDTTLYCVFYGAPALTTINTMTGERTFGEPILPPPGIPRVNDVDLSHNDEHLYISDSAHSQIIVTGQANYITGVPYPVGVAVSHDNKHLYVTDVNMHSIYHVDLLSFEVSLLAGTGTPGYTDGIGSEASFNTPVGITIDSSDMILYVAEPNNNRIRKIDISSREVTTFAGSGWPVTTDGIGTGASFNDPAYIDINSTGTKLYVSEYNGATVREIDINTKEVTTIVGQEVGLLQPRDIVASQDETTLYLADYGNNRVLKIVLPLLADTISPANVTDLHVAESTTSSVILTWTAPGDDEDVGAASEYDIRYSTIEPTLSNEATWWTSAIQASSEPIPMPVGSSENFTITGLTTDSIYYFALKTADEVPNWSGLSNIVSSLLFSEQPQLKAPWTGISTITQGNNGATSHHDYGTWDNTYAIDVALNIGSDVLAAADGTVVSVDNDASGAGGKELAIEHYNSSGNKFVTVYLHLSQILVGIGSAVQQGQVVAKSGDTGNVTGAHLHFHVWSGVGSYDSHTMPIERLVMKQIDVDNEFREYDSSKGELEDSIIAGKSCESNNVPIIIDTSPPTCHVTLCQQNTTIPIDTVDIGQIFSICVGASIDNTGIKEVRLSSDDSQDGVLTGEWTALYDWNISSGDWNAATKVKAWSFTTGGNKEVWAEVKDGSGNTSQSHVNIWIHPGYAILVAGQADWRQKAAIDHSANNAYRVLRNLGFDNEHIFYLNVVPQQIGGLDVVDGAASLQDLQGSLDNLKQQVGDSPAPLVLYLVGHGIKEVFDFYTESEALSSDGLRDMLEPFNNSPMLIVIGSCYSGSFVTKDLVTDSISSNNRIIVTATHDDEKRLSILGLGGWYHSSDRFWCNLNEGLNVMDAFVSGAWPGEWQHLWLDDNGDCIGHSPVNLVSDGTLASATKIGVPGTENLELTSWYSVWIHSPGELRVYDSQKRVTGLVNGEVKEEIPGSIYDEENKIVVIYSSSDTYCYEVVGTDQDTYGLDITFIEDGEAADFGAAEVPITSGAKYEYTIDWAALSQGEKGVTIKKDSDGDGTFEETVLTTPPYTPTAPSPSSGSSGVSISIPLSWTGGDPDQGDNVTYTMYLGTSWDPPLVSLNLTENTYTPSTLDYDTTYHWRVVSRDNHGISNEGSIWSFTTSSPPSPAPPAGGGGGGGGGGSDKTMMTSGLKANAPLLMNSGGKTINNSSLATTDGKATLIISTGTTILNANGNPLAVITAAAIASPPAAPEDNALILAYTFGPPGTTFDPAIVLSMTYDPANLPDGVDETNLYISYYDGTSWVNLESTVDPVTHTVTAKVSHFSSYALMGKIGPASIPAPTPMPTPTPTVVAPTTPAPIPTVTPTPTRTPTPMPATTAVQPTTSIPATTAQSMTDSPPPTTKPETPEPFSFTMIIGIILAAVLLFSIIAVVFIIRRNSNTKP